MAVTVLLTEKNRGDNHRIEFRPTNSDRLEKVEQQIADTYFQAVNAIPAKLYEDIIFGRITESQVEDRIARAIRKPQQELEFAIFVAYADGLNDMLARLRNDINKELIKLNSNARLIAEGEVSKATDKLVYNPFPEFTDPPDLKLFNSLPDDIEAKVYARTRSGQIFTTISADVQQNIETILVQGFTEARTISTGQTLYGLNQQETARRIFGLLQTVAPTPITGADYASKVVPYTNGLFPRWALAVDRSMNSYALKQSKQRLKQFGNYSELTPTQQQRYQRIARDILSRTEKHGKRYGDQLRRARARMIARTETSFARNAGHLQVMQEAQASGLTGPNSKKVWVTGGFDVCDICVPLNGQKVLINQNFSWQGGGGATPPAHPNCRCTIRNEPAYVNPPTLIEGSNTMADPSRYRFPDGFEINVL